MSTEASDRLRDVRSDDYHLDGNALGGFLADVFGQEVTGGWATCGDCGATNAIGATMVYGRPPASVLACPGCGAVMLVIIRKPDGFLLTFHGLEALQIGG